MNKLKSVPAYNLFNRKNSNSIGYANYIDSSGNRKRVYFPGPGRSNESLNAYRKWINSNCSASALVEYEKNIAERGLTVADLCARFALHAQNYYQKHGRSTGGAEKYALAIRPLLELAHDQLADSITPIHLDQIESDMIRGGLCRTTINMRLDEIKNIFKWGAGKMIVKLETWQLLAIRPRLKKWRSAAKESKHVTPASDHNINIACLYLSSVLADAVGVIRFTGMRAGEALNMSWDQIDQSGVVWIYTPHEHKTEHWDIIRKIPIGRRAQAILEKYRNRQENSPIFSPKEAVTEHDARRAEKLKSGKRSPAHQNSWNNRHRRADLVGDQYTAHAFNTAIKRACLRAGIDPFTPTQLRHAAATELRDKYGLDVAQVVLGHSSAKTTQIYADLNLNRAVEAVKDIW